MRRVRKHWQNGRHSNLPVCCILYFIVRVRVVPHPILVAHAERVPRHRARHHGYIQCPLCRLRGRYVTQHLCDWRCS